MLSHSPNRVTADSKLMPEVWKNVTTQNTTQNTTPVAPKPELQYEAPYAIDPAHPGDSGMDLAFYDDDCSHLMFKPFQVRAIPTGVYFHIPEGHEIQLRAKSGISLKTSFMLANGVGTVDRGYTEEVHVLLRNVSDKPAKLARGTKIAQAVLCHLAPHNLTRATKLKPRFTSRGGDGFGSTGEKVTMEEMKNVISN